MSICSKCKKELGENEKFCSECGTKVPRSILCSHCKKKVNKDFLFCPYCGTEMINEVPKRIGIISQFNIEKKILKIGSGVVATILVIVLLASVILNAVSKDNYLFYIKHEELLSANIKNLKKREISESFAESTQIDKKKIKNNVSSLSKHVKISEDKKNIFYLDRLESMSQFSLYHRKLDSIKESNKVAKDVTMFEISNKGDCVAYLQAGGTLCWDNLKERKQIASDVATFHMSEDGKTLVYLTEEGDGYHYVIGEEREKIDSQITDLSYVSEDLKTVYYLKSAELYKKDWGKEAVLISSDVKQIVKAYETGEIYYLKGTEFVVNLKDYVEDDMLEEDALKEIPKIPSSPVRGDYATQEEYEQAHAQYIQAMLQHQEITPEDMYQIERQKLRTDGLEGRTVNIPQKKLCYFDGKKEEIVSEKVIEYKAHAEEKSVVIYSAYRDSEVSKVKFSEIQSSYNVEEMVRQSFLSQCDYYVTVKGKSCEINVSGAYSFNINAQADSIYMLAEKMEDSKEETSVETEGMNQLDLYHIKVSGKKTGNPTKIDSNVYSIINLVDNNHYVYYKNVDNQRKSGDMYMDGRKVESDVRLNTIKFDKQTGNLWYMVDWEDKDQQGTLKRYNDGKIVRVSDEVYQYEIMPDGEILYLYDYSVENYEGELYLYKRNKAHKVDDDVVVIIPTNEEE